MRATEPPPAGEDWRATRARRPAAPPRTAPRLPPAAPPRTRRPAHGPARAPPPAPPPPPPAAARPPPPPPPAGRWARPPPPRHPDPPPGHRRAPIDRDEGRQDLPPHARGDPGAGSPPPDPRDQIVKAEPQDHGPAV